MATYVGAALDEKVWNNRRYTRRPALERFLEKVDKTDTCWIWCGSRADTGYGNMYMGPGQVVLAHRFSYEHFVGPIPDGLTLDHLCRVRLCVNPEHLEAVSHRENVLRGLSPTAANATKKHCPKGHLYDAFDGRSRRCRICRREQFRRASAKRRAARKR